MIIETNFSLPSAISLLCMTKWCMFVICSVETMVVNGYDHILDIRGMKKLKTAREIAEQRGFAESLHLLDILTKYQVGSTRTFVVSKLRHLRSLHYAPIRSAVPGYGQWRECENIVFAH